jgi:hypothetical protein
MVSPNPAVAGVEQASVTIDPPLIGHTDGTFCARLLVTGPVITGEQLTTFDGAG